MHHLHFLCSAEQMILSFVLLFFLCEPLFPEITAEIVIIFTR